MPKRNYQSAFPSSMWTSLQTVHQDPSSLHSQSRRLHSTSSLFVPGQWPRADSVEPEPSAAGSDHSHTFLTSVGQWAVAVSSIFSIPRRLAQGLQYRQQKIAAVPVRREDCSSKKRLVDAGTMATHTTSAASSEAHNHITNPIGSAHYQDAHDSTGFLARHAEELEHVSVNAEYTCDGNGLDISFSDLIPTRRAHATLSRSMPPISPESQSAPLSKPTMTTLIRHRSFPAVPRTHQHVHGTSVNRPPVAQSTGRLLKKQLRRKSSLPILRNHLTTTTNQEPRKPGPQSEHLNAYSTPFSPIDVNASCSPSSRDDDSARSSSHLSTAQTSISGNDLSFLGDASTTPCRKGSRLARKLGTRVNGMLESTIKTIAPTSAKGLLPIFTNSVPSLHARKQANDEGLPVTPSNPPNLHPTLIGNPLHSQDFIDELQISDELLEDIQRKLQGLLAQAPRPLVTHPTNEEMQQLRAAAHASAQNPGYYIVPEKLTAKDFGTLLPAMFNGNPKAWLNDEVVNEYLRILTADKKKEYGFEHKRGGPAPPVHTFSSFWYSTASRGLKQVARWASRVQLGGSHYLQAKLIIYPICDVGHWRLLTVKPRDRIIEYLDSLGFNGDKYIRTLKDYLKQELGDAWIEDEWTVLQTQRSSQQLNGSDCGVFTLLNALVMLSNIEPERVESTCGMQEARERIGITLMAGKSTFEWA